VSIAVFKAMDAPTRIFDLVGEVHAEVSHTDLATGKTEKADLYLGAKDLVEVLDDGTRNVAKLTNILDLDELRSVLEKHL
jgi:PTS system ascorbate-specific IIB component